MVENVKKRDGRIVLFDKNKIISAVEKAMAECGISNSRLPSRIAAYIANLDEQTMDIERIQDIVEAKLMASNQKEVAKKYIIYRNDRNRNREKNGILMKEISEKLSAEHVQNQNANVDERSFGGRIGSATSAVMKKYALDYCMSEMSRNNHLNNEVYIHDLDHFAIGDHNCFQRNTRFITTEGIKSFEDFKDGSKVTVLAKDGKWRDATIRFYGRQPMQHVVFERCGIKKEVNCTKNHRWLLSNGEVTDSLKIGDLIFPLVESTQFNINTKRQSEMFCFGFIIGDGCDHVVWGNNVIQVLLCGNKRQYKDIFESADFRKQETKVQNSIMYAKRSSIGKQEFLTCKMWRILSFEDKVALFNGYMCADGSKTTATKHVWTSDNRVLEMIKEISALCGYHIFNITEQNNSTNYKDNRLLYEIALTKKHSTNSTWKVIEIKKQPNKDYEAWCVEEPITHSFTLDGGLVTGNCMSIPFDKLLANGFTTRQTDVRPAQSVNTAFQLVAVLFQLQSLQQFGKQLCRIKTLRTYSI